ncbi:hypothetical protein [Olleya namhaensis]|uniref:hypothetical protein n=1 Tax=Olleya namhaensis TaxID=1144750 RepID=UPI00248FCAF8|nr:hypothetical protein [Olleya namhaensis]
MKSKSIIPIQFLIGLIFALGAGLLMYLDILPIFARIGIGILGLVLLATSKYKIL